MWKNHIMVLFAKQAVFRPSSDLKTASAEFKVTSTST
jgi:hypothetical protein